MKRADKQGNKRRIEEEEKGNKTNINKKRTEIKRKQKQWQGNKLKHK